MTYVPRNDSQLAPTEVNLIPHGVGEGGRLSSL